MCSCHKCICVVLLLPIQYIWAVLIAATVCRLGCYHQYIYTNTIWTGDHTNANNPFSVTISSLRVQSWSCSCWHGPTGPTVHLTQSCLQIWRVSPGGADWHTVYSQQWVSQPAFDILSSPSGTFSYLTISRSHQVWPINGHYVFLPAQSDWIFQASVTSWYNGYHCRTLYSQCRPYCDQVSQVLLGPTGSVLSETKREGHSYPFQHPLIFRECMHYVMQILFLFVMLMLTPHWQSWTLRSDWHVLTNCRPTGKWQSSDWQVAIGWLMGDNWLNDGLQSADWWVTNGWQLVISRPTVLH